MSGAATASADRVPQDFSHRQILVILTGLLLGMGLAALDQTIVAAALPTITGELGGIGQLSWVITAYLLATTASTPVYGKLGDQYGRKRLFQLAIVVFLVGSMLCGLSRSIEQLIAFRAVQGLGAGGLLVLAQAIIAEIVPPRQRGRYQGYMGAVFGASSVAGPILGGFLTDEVSWRWVFYVNLPLGLVALAVTAVVLPSSQRQERPRVDYVGAVALTMVVTGVVLITTWGGTEYAWTSPTILTLAATTLGMSAVLFIVETRVPEPIVPRHLFHLPTFIIASTGSLMVGVALFGTISFLPLFLQVVSGASATSSGLLLTPLMLGLLTASVLSGQVITRAGRYKAFPIVGTGIAALAMYLLSTMSTATSQTTVTAYMVVLGAGVGMTIGPLVLSVQNVVAIRDLGVATSWVTFLRSTGGAIGVALFGAVFNTLLRDQVGTSVAFGEGADFSPESIQALPPERRAEYIGAFADSLTTVFLFAVPLVLVAFVAVSFLVEVPLRRTYAEPWTEATTPSQPPAGEHPDDATTRRCSLSPARGAPCGEPPTRPDRPGRSSRSRR